MHDDRVELRVLKDCNLGREGDVRMFWVRGDKPGYVYEEYGASRTGTLGKQACNHLGHMGSTLFCSQERLLHVIRREAQACLRAEDREERRYWY